MSFVTIVTSFASRSSIDVYSFVQQDDYVHESLLLGLDTKCKVLFMIFISCLDLKARKNDAFVLYIFFWNGHFTKSNFEPMQSKCSQNTFKIDIVKINKTENSSFYKINIQIKYSQNAVKTQPKFNQNSVKIQSLLGVLNLIEWTVFSLVYLHNAMSIF